MRNQETNLNTATLAYPQEKASNFDGVKNNLKQGTEKGRDKMEMIHKPNDAIAKTVGGVGTLLASGADASSSVMTNAFTGIKDVLTKGSQNNTLNKLGLGALSGIFGVAGLKSALDFLKSIFGKAKPGGKRAGILLSGTQALFGSAMAVGVFRTLMGNPGMFGFGTMATGTIGFLLLSMIKGNYQNPQSFGAKIFNLFGLGDKTNSLVDSFSLNTRANNEVLK